MAQPAKAFNPPNEFDFYYDESMHVLINRYQSENNIGIADVSINHRTLIIHLTDGTTKSIEYDSNTPLFEYYIVKSTMSHFGISMSYVHSFTSTGETEMTFQEFLD